MNQTGTIDLSVILPALNEEKSVALCVQKALKSIQNLGIKGEVIVVDNGSNDRTAVLAREAGAKVIEEPRRGYGNAYLAGFHAACGKFLIVGDADDSYNLEEIAPFYQKLKDGYDFVMGNRYKGKIEKGAMPFFAPIYRDTLFNRGYELVF